MLCINIFFKKNVKNVLKKIFKTFLKKLKKFTNCLLKHCKIWKHVQLKHLKLPPISRKLENAQNSKTCSKQKKVARNTKSCRLVASPSLIDNDEKVTFSKKHTQFKT